MTVDLLGARPGLTNSLLDVPGIRVGHAVAGDSGVTVVACPGGAVAAVDVRGGGPGTRETDVLEPHNTVQEAHAVVLSGGSAFGLDAASGVMNSLAERGIGFPVLGLQYPDKVVPIVPAAVIFDLLAGDWDARPTAVHGAAALAAALDDDAVNGAESGNVGVGVAATAGALKGGFGQASAVIPPHVVPEGSPLAGVNVAVGVAVNPQGSVYDPRTGQLWSLAAGLEGEKGSEFSRYGLAISDGEKRGLSEKMGSGEKNLNSALGVPGAVEISDEARAALAGLNIAGTKLTEGQRAPQSHLNTTIGVVATDAPLSKAQVKRLCLSSHDGLARAIRPAHMPMDGDTLFGLATSVSADGPQPGIDPLSLTLLCAVAAQATERAVAHAVLAAEPAFGLPSWRSIVHV